MARLKALLNLNKSSKSKGLKLEGLALRFYPDARDLDWLEYLSLENNFISDSDKYLLPTNLKELNLEDNLFQEIIPDNFPLNLINLSLRSNQLKKFDGAKFISLEFLNLSKNTLSNIIYPPNIKYLDISENKFKILPEFPIHLLEIDLSNNLLLEIPKIKSENLKKILFSENKISGLPDLPETLVEIHGDSNYIKFISDLPADLGFLNLENNLLDAIYCQLPKKLVVLKLDRNSLKAIPVLPELLEELYISKNKLIYLPEIPKSVHKLDISINNLTNIPSELYTRPYLKLESRGNLDSTFRCRHISDSDEEYYHKYSYYSGHTEYINPKNLPSNPNLISINNKKQIII